MRKQLEREPERIRRWKAELERQMAAEKERDKWDHSKFPRLSDLSR